MEARGVKLAEGGARTGSFTPKRSGICMKLQVQAERKSLRQPTKVSSPTIGKV